MEDQLIIKLFFQRSENAIEELAQKYGKLCNAISINILKNKEDAEECVNDTWLAVWNTVPPKEPNPLQAYVSEGYELFEDMMARISQEIVNFCLNARVVVQQRPAPVQAGEETETEEKTGSKPKKKKKKGKR